MTKTVETVNYHEPRGGGNAIIQDLFAAGRNKKIKYLKLFDIVELLIQNVESGS